MLIAKLPDMTPIGQAPCQAGLGRNPYGSVLWFAWAGSTFLLIWRGRQAGLYRGHTERPTAAQFERAGVGGRRDLG